LFIFHFIEIKKKNEKYKNVLNNKKMSDNVFLSKFKVDKHKKYVYVGKKAYEIIKVLTEGASGDSLIKIKDKGKTYIIKLSKNMNNFNNEIYFGMLLYTMFKNKNPIVKIFDYGFSCLYDSNLYFYYIMEDLSTDYEEYDKFVMKYCLKTLLSETDLYAIRSVFKNIFYAIKIFKLKGINHCDLHTYNIFVNEKDYSIKIIDFGLANKTKCKVSRTTTTKIINTFKKCKRNSIKMYGDILVENVTNKSLDSDLSMLITLTSLFFYNKEKSKQFQTLEQISENINTNNGNKKKLLDEFDVTLKNILCK
jgi:serine/threonine protein kinase